MSLASGLEAWRDSDTYLSTLRSVLQRARYNGVTKSGPQRELSQGVAQAKLTPIGENHPRILMALDNAWDVWTYVTFGIKYCDAFHKLAASVLDMSKGKLSELDAVAFTYAFIGAKELPDSFRWRTPTGMGKAYDDFVTSKLGPRAADVRGVNATDCFKNAVRQFLGIRKVRMEGDPRSGNGQLDFLLQSGLGDLTMACKAIVALMRSFDDGSQTRSVSRGEMATETIPIANLRRAQQ